jgi:hypothetical protein
MADNVTPFAKRRAGTNGAAGANGKPAGDDDDEALFARIKSFAAITAQPAHDIPWDIPGLLPSDESPALAFGPPSATKSWHLKHVVDCMASGDDFLGRFPVRKRDSALYINIDAGEKSFENRLRGSRFNLAVLRKLLKRHEHGFIVIDSLPAFFLPPQGDDPARAMRDFLEAVQAEYAEFDCGGILADHPHRPKEPGTLGDYYGNIQKEATIRCMWSISATKTPGSAQVHATIACRKMNEGTDFAAVHSIVDFSETIVRFSAGESTPNHNPLEAKILDWAKRRGPEPFTMQNVDDSVTGRSKDIRIAVNGLVDLKAIGPTGRKRCGGALLLHADFLGSPSLGDGLLESQ